MLIMLVWWCGGVGECDQGVCIQWMYCMLHVQYVCVCVCIQVVQRICNCNVHLYMYERRVEGEIEGLRGERKRQRERQREWGGGMGREIQEKEIYSCSCTCTYMYSVYPSCLLPVFCVWVVIDFYAFQPFCFNHSLYQQALHLLLNDP